MYNVVTSKPVASATVSLMNRGGPGKPEVIQTTQTDERGVFQLDDIPTGGRNSWYSLSVEADGLAARDLGIQSYLPGSTQHFITYLSPLETVKGRVVDDQEQPVAGARVAPFTILGIDGRGYNMPNRPETKSDAEGRFTLKLPQGSAFISCQSESLHQRDFLKLHEIPNSDLLIEMEGTVKVTIRLINDQDQPLADKVVSFEPRRDPIGKWGGSGNTNAKGEVSFEGVPAGEYVIRPGGPNGKHKKIVTIHSGKSVEITFSTN